MGGHQHLCNETSGWETRISLMCQSSWAFDGFISSSTSDPEELAGRGRDCCCELMGGGARAPPSRRQRVGGGVGARRRRGGRAQRGRKIKLGVAWCEVLGDTTMSPPAPVLVLAALWRSTEQGGGFWGHPPVPVQSGGIAPSSGTLPALWLRSVDHTTCTGLAKGSGNKKKKNPYALKSHVYLSLFIVPAMLSILVFSSFSPSFLFLGP